MGLELRQRPEAWVPALALALVLRAVPAEVVIVALALALAMALVLRAMPAEVVIVVQV